MTEPRKGDWCQLQSGRQFWPLDPRPDDFTIEDIAHGCAAEPRYGGHTLEPYSVAQHSIYVSRRAEQLALLTDKSDLTVTKIALWGLMHDASEGLGLKDIPAPLKRYLPEYLLIEKDVMRVVCVKLNLPIEQPIEVTTADSEVFAAEARDLFPEHARPAPWPGLPKEPSPILPIGPWPLGEAKQDLHEAIQGAMVMIVVIEGVDGASKTTQSKLLAMRLGARLFSFPAYETETGKLILGHLKGEWTADGERGWNGAASIDQLNSIVLQALFLANKYEFAEEIRTAARKGSVVLDRYWPSAVVYGCSDGLPVDWLCAIHSSLPPADLYILLDCDSETSCQRRPERRDMYERDGKLDERAERYRKLWRERRRSEPERWRWTDGRLPLDVVSHGIAQCLVRLTERRLGL